MLRKTLATAAIIAASSTFAFAADPVYPEAAPVAASGYNWSGAYVGGQFGYGWSGADWVVNNNTIIGFDNATTSTSHDLSGWMAGVHGGVNWQSGNVLTGLEVSYSWSKMDGSSFGPIDDVYTTEIEDLFTITGRFGLAQDNILYYVRGGYASASIGSNYSDTGLPIVGSGSDRQTHHGWTLGTGIDFAISSKTSVGIAYDYIDLGTENHDWSASPSAFGPADIDLNPGGIHAVTVRISFKID